MSYETQSLQLDSTSQLFFKTPEKNSYFQDKLLPHQTNDVQAMLLQSEIVWEMQLSANWKPNYRDRTKQAVKKLHLYGKMAADKKKEPMTAVALITLHALTRQLS